MSHNEYLKEFEADINKKVDVFKENIVNSKEFINAFMSLTDNNPDEKRNELFESLMTNLENTCKHTLKPKEV